LWADKRFGGELDFLIGLSVPFHVDTNGTHVDLETADRLFVSKVTSINVSIDAARNETYRRIRRGAPHLDKIFEHMRILYERRALAERFDVKLSAAYVLMKSNLDELPEFVRRVHEVGFEAVRVSHLQAYTPDMDEESLWWAQKDFNKVRSEAVKQADELGIILYIDRPFQDRADRVGTSFCALPWNGAYLLGNGDVLACCVPGLRMGNLHEQSMEEIWNGPRYQELRRTVNSNERPAACMACPFHRKTNNPFSYMPHRTAEWVGSAGKKLTTSLGG
jgi:radical SAM protein with 4Fe4S-binding SPASM domain